MHVILNNFLEYIAMENGLFGPEFLFLDASRIYDIASRLQSSMLQALPIVICLVQSLITSQFVT
jgi:hypothetical protein